MTDNAAAPQADPIASADGLAGSGFVHLRLRSEYSISDSIVRLDAAVGAAVADGQPALALTDSSNLFGWVRFYKTARRKGLQPICGVDSWITNVADRERPHRLLLIASTDAGYRNLCELLSRAWLENEYRGRAEIDPSWFTPAAVEGLIVLSGAQNGEVGQALDAGDRAGAERVALRLAKTFPDAFYLEVQRTGSRETEGLTRETAQLAARLGLPLVATHPIQFIGRSDYQAHEARVCIAEGEILGNPRRVRRYTGGAVLPDPWRDGGAVRRSSGRAREFGRDRAPLQPVADARANRDCRTTRCPKA